MKRIYVSVSNDIYNDNRVLRTCRSLVVAGREVFIAGKKTSLSPAFEDNDLHIHRFQVWFKKNFLYYAELNIRLFFYLLFRKQDMLWANDLDTLLPNYLVSRIKRIPLIYDSHELFCYVPELKENSFQQRVWLFLEKKTVPHLRYVITVCDPIKQYFLQKYNVKAEVVRNIPDCNTVKTQKKTYPLAEKYIVWQGAANMDRGLEELTEAMQYVDAKLVILGRGDIIPEIEKLIKKYSLQNKVFLKGRVTFEQMMQYTANATLGISIDKPTNRNYAVSLPNKIFEYIHAATPVLYSPLAEIKNIEMRYRTGVEIISYNALELAKQINDIINDNALLQQMSDNCMLAARELSWDNEQKIIHNILLRADRRQP
ncbi:MAG: glycosyltransferase [Bacteroidales bacterium]|nr:glycosyltransferase [Bacteroidales bacterium]MBP3254830.1 glycosyltransferase [Bacteroidales bacterium]